MDKKKNMINLQNFSCRGSSVMAYFKSVFVNLPARKGLKEKTYINIKKFFLTACRYFRHFNFMTFPYN